MGNEQPTPLKHAPELVTTLAGQWQLWYIPHKGRSVAGGLHAAWRNFKLVSLQPRRRNTFYLAVHVGSGIYARNSDHDYMVRLYDAAFVEHVRAAMAAWAARTERS